MRDEMQSPNNDASPGSYCTQLSMASQSDALDPTFDDMTIAEGLLNNSKVPHRSSSFTGTRGFEPSNDKFGSSVVLTETSTAGISRRAIFTSNTWTSSSGGVLSDQNEIDDRTIFVQEFNRLARKHGIRPMVPEDDDAVNDDANNAVASRDSWFSRKILRRTSSTQSVKPERNLQHRRSISDLSLRMKLKKDKLKDKDLQELVRFCGSSLLYLPSEYAAGSLAVPTCFRATAQYLVQHGTTTRGVFRIPGSHTIVAALYNHYCSMDQNGECVSGTVRCPTLPEHIRCDVHDVASAFKKFISGLPGGILGSLPLFYALVSIQSQLHGDPELTRTKQSKVRARLIALAIATLRSQYRRELICTVFGLLCMIGRAAEISRREDERGRPLPTSDLMGYGPLGIVFGPLLVGDLLEDYNMRLANPHGGLILLPISPPKSRKERKKKAKSSDEGSSFNTYVDKIKVANSIAEMVITHWRDVVRHLKNLSALKIVRGYNSSSVGVVKPPFLRPSASESFAMRKPPDWDDGNTIRRVERSVSPTPARRVRCPVGNTAGSFAPDHNDILKVGKQRSTPRPLSSLRLSVAKSLSVLSPTVEELTKEDQSATQSRSLHTKGDSDASGSSNKENRHLPDVFKENISASGSLSLASKEKSTTVHPQLIKNLQHIEPSLCTAKGIAREIPKSLRIPYKDTVVHFQKEIATEHAKKNVLPRSKTLVTSAPNNHGEFTRTHLQQFSSSTAPQNGLGNIDSVAQAKITLASKLAREAEVKIARNLDQKNPKALVYRASSRETDFGITKNHCRLGDSEPGAPMKVQDRSPRKISRSMYDEPQRMKKLFELDYKKKFPSKDPLARVSQEDDLTSLAELAQVLDIRDEQILAGSEAKVGGVDHGVPCTTTSRKQTTATDEREVASNFKNSAYKNSIAQTKSTGNNAAITQREKRIDEKEPSLPKHDSNFQTANCDSTLTDPSTPKRILTSTNPVTPGSKTNQPRNSVKIDPTNQPASPSSRFSALVAKFNNTSSQSTPDLSPSRPREKSLTTFLPEDNQKRGDTPKEGVVAPYTTNAPSPAKSQKSGKSNNTPQSMRGSLNSSLKVDAEGTPGSRREVLPLRKDSTTSRPVQRSYEDSGPPSFKETHSATTQSNLVICRNPPYTAEDTSQTEPSPPNMELECPFLIQKTIEEIAQEKGEPCSFSGQSIQAQGEQMTTSRREMPSSKDSPVSSEAVTIHPSIVTREVPIFDGSTTTLDIKKLPISFLTTESGLLRTKLSPGLLDTTSFLHPESLVRDKFTPPNPVSPARSPPPPGRRSSVLYAQIRTLQRRLSSKSEEIQRLKKQLDARGSFDVGTLSERLREAEKEMEVWKTRAKVAETQLEVFTKKLSKDNSHQLSKVLSPKPSRILTRANTGCAEEITDMKMRMSRALRGIDGNESPGQRISDESNHTVIREDIQGSK